MALMYTDRVSQANLPDAASEAVHGGHCGVRCEAFTQAERDRGCFAETNT